MNHFDRNYHNGDWCLVERDNFFAVKHFENTFNLRDYLNKNKEIKENNYSLKIKDVGKTVYIEMELGDYLNLPKKLKNE